MPKLLLIVILCALFACARPQSESPLLEAQYYTYLPGNFIIELAAGSTVLLDPSVRHFVLFRSVEEAKLARERALAEGKIPAGDWKIYSLEPSSGAYKTAEGYLLGRSAALSDWIPE